MQQIWRSVYPVSMTALGEEVGGVGGEGRREEWQGVERRGKGGVVGAGAGCVTVGDGRGRGSDRLVNTCETTLTRQIHMHV